MTIGPWWCCWLQPIRVVRTWASLRRSTSSRKRCSTFSDPWPPQWWRPTVVQTKTCRVRGASGMGPHCARLRAGRPPVDWVAMTLSVDMHMHTVASDGDLTPEELGARCAGQGLRAGVGGAGGGVWGEGFACGKAVSTEGAYQPELPEAIGWVRDAGGVPVLAHPGATLGSLDPEAAFAELFGEGLGGVEAW